MKPIRPNKIRALIAATCLMAATSGYAEVTVAPAVSAEFVFKYLIGEIAGQRGDPILASNLFLDLAKSSRDPRLAERATRVAAFARQPELTARAAALWAELDPSSKEAAQAASQSLLSAGSLAEAKPYIQKLLAAEETRAGGFLYLSQVLSRFEDKAEVLAFVMEIAKPYPRLAEAHFAIANSALAAGNVELAKAELGNAEKLKPELEVVILLKGQLLAAESPAKAIDLLSAYLAKYPNANETRLTLAKLLINEKRFDEAKTHFTKLIDASNGNPEIIAVIGLLAMQSNDLDAADKYLKLAIDHGFKNPEQLALYLGQIAEKRKQYADAIVWYKKITSDGARFDAQLRVANVLATQGKLDESRKYLDSLNGITVEQQVTVLQLEANFLTQAKRYQEAFNLLEKAVETMPNTPEIVYDYAMVAERVQRFDVMEKQLRKLILLKPDFVQAYNALGYTLAERNERLSEAQDLIQKALTLSPNDHYILDSMGWVQYRMGKLDMAVDYLRKAYTAQADPDIAAHLGEVLWKQGKQNEAKEVWQSALREHPENESLLSTTKKFLP